MTYNEIKLILRFPLCIGKEHHGQEEVLDGAYSLPSEVKARQADFRASKGKAYSISTRYVHVGRKLFNEKLVFLRCVFAGLAQHCGGNRG